MTVAMLLQNTLISALRYLSPSLPKFSPLPLKLMTPVPSDLIIAQSQKPKRIEKIAEECGILPAELTSYGKYKAKVSLSVADRLSERQDGYYIVVSG